jgi:hypothetical protein
MQVQEVRRVVVRLQDGEILLPEVGIARLATVKGEEEGKIRVVGVENVFACNPAEDGSCLLRASLAGRISLQSQTEELAPNRKKSSKCRETTIWRTTDLYAEGKGVSLGYVTAHMWCGEQRVSRK